MNCLCAAEEKRDIISSIIPRRFIERRIRKDYDNPAGLLEAINLSGGKFGASELISLRRGETVKVPLSESFKDIYYSAAGNHKVRILNDEVMAGGSRLSSRYVPIAAGLASGMEGLSKIVGMEEVKSVGIPQIAIIPRIDAQQYYLVGELESRDEKCTAGTPYPTAFSTKKGITISVDLIGLGHSWMYSGISHELVHFYRQHRSNTPDMMIVEVDISGDKDIYRTGSINVIFEEVIAEFIGNSVALNGRFSDKHSIAMTNLIRLCRYLDGFEHKSMGRTITPTEAGHFLGIYLYAGAVIDDAAYKKLIKDQNGLRLIKPAGMKEFMGLFENGDFDKGIRMSNELIGETASLENLDKLCIATVGMGFRSLLGSFDVSSISPV